jgi:tungstate transport system ATP-binding protein
MASIHLQNVHLRQAERLILDIESNEIPVSNITGIIGPNGAGKTILLKLIAGLIQNPKFQISCSFKDISMVLSQTPLLKMSVRGNFLMLKDTHPDLSDEKINAVLKAFLLDHVSDSPATKISTGERQRLAIARAYLIGAELLILDEPTASLDPQSTLLIESKIIDLANQGIKFLIASHDFAQVKRICNQVVFIKDGKIIEKGHTQDFFSNPKHPETKSFISFYE